MSAIPGRDHYSIWYDRDTKRHLFVDEPYEEAAKGKLAGRQASIPSARLVRDLKFPDLPNTPIQSGAAVDASAAHSVGTLGATPRSPT